MKRKSESTLIRLFGGYRPTNTEIVTERTKSLPWTIIDHPSSTTTEKEQLKIGVGAKTFQVGKSCLGHSHCDRIKLHLSGEG